MTTQQESKKSITFSLPSKYKVVQCIGQGAYGSVVSAIDEDTGEMVAIKKVSDVFEQTEEYQARILREVAVLKHLRGHSNIIELKEVIQPDDYETFRDVYIVSNLMDVTFKDMLRDRNTMMKMTDEHVKWFLYQILRGVKYMHSAGIVHRDLKPANLLLNDNMDLMICDMGLAREFDAEDEKEMSTYVVTRWYRSPELILGYERTGPAVDMWSIGCIFAEMLRKSHRPLFGGSSSIQQIELILDVLGTPQTVKGNPGALRWLKKQPVKPKKSLSHLFPKTTSAALDLLERMLHMDPDQRISAEQALRHEYLADLHDETDEPVSTEKFQFTVQESIQIKDQMYDQVKEFKAER
jgi:serine/threonine protein kinase